MPTFRRHDERADQRVRNFLTIVGQGYRGGKEFFSAIWAVQKSFGSNLATSLAKAKDDLMLRRRVATGEPRANG